MTKRAQERIDLASVEKVVRAYDGLVYPELNGEQLTYHVKIPVDTEDY